MWKIIIFTLVAGAASHFVTTPAQAITGNWGGANGNWSSTTGPAGWTNGTAPNGQGDIALDSVGASVTTTQDIAGGVTVGTIKANFTTNNSWQITPNNNLFFNQDGAGPQRASIINDIHSTGSTGNPAIFLNDVATSQYVLQDDLFISNTSNSTRGNGSVQIKGTLTGAGNIWIENVSTDPEHGQIAFTNNESRPGVGGFSGNVTIAKGAVTFSRGDCFSPTPGNVVTIGAGMGEAKLAYAGVSLDNMENNIVVAANPGGAHELETTSAATGLVNIKSSNSFAASITLNGNLAFIPVGGGTLQIGDPITGVGRVSVYRTFGGGRVRLTNANSYTGGTLVVLTTLSVGHTDAINNGSGFYVATDGTLGTGNVDIDSGKLEIESGVAGVDVIANTASVTVEAGAIFQLDAGVNERVGGLVFADGRGSRTAPGTYGSTASGATYQNDTYFSGPGVITLSADFNDDGVVDASDYALWRKSPASNLSNGGYAAYANWRANFGNPVGAGSSFGSNNIPEPNTMLLLVAAIVFLRTEWRR